MKILNFIMAAVCCATFVSCIDVEERDDTRRGNYDALWTIIDEHYCYFDYKKAEYGLDWSSVYEKYKTRADTVRTIIEQFDVFSDMLDELRDGHVNLTSEFNYARYWDWKENYPENFSDSILRRYIGTDYYMAGGLKYCVIRDSIAYIRCASFSTAFSNNNLSYALLLLKDCPALILDLRNNGGGELTLAERLASRFTEKKILTGYMRHKTGKGHSDFSDYEERYIEPSAGVQWTKPVIVLTNRSVFSAANECVNELRCCPKVTVIGDRTGGGGGLPFTSELPNGWTVRFSACPMYDKDKNDIEFGIEPDYKVDITSEDYQKGIDTIIEFAINYIINLTEK